MIPSNDVWIRRMIKVEPVRHAFARPRNRGV